MVLKGILFAIVTAILFYDNILTALFFLPFGHLYIKVSKAGIVEKKKFDLSQDFSEAIACLAGVLEGGISIENAIMQTYRDMEMTHGKDSMMMKELRFIGSQTANNIRIEEAFLGLANRTDLEDIRSFADVFATAKRTGGNIISIIRETSNIIRTKNEVARELRTVMASKKFESDIMRIIPYLMLIYLRISSPDMLSMLYGNIKGFLFMSLMLTAYIAMSFLAGKIVRIRI
ncbi:MAG: type II secretion system F family protein [Lachnospiraceae bacterium]|nr:type II secretion system F family protein [Lachnospiraceae bacterium]